jgi:hypothetical protein
MQTIKAIGNILISTEYASYTCFFFLARFQILQDMFSSRVFLSCGLLIADVLTTTTKSRVHHWKK